MATPQELQDQYDALEQKRADLYNRMQSLSDQHASSNASLLGHDFAAMDKIRFNSALQPLRAQDRVLHQQQAALKSELLRADRDAKIALGAPAAAAKAQLAAQKAQADARKLASTNLEDQSARAFGLGTKKGIDYVTQQGAFYDPIKGQIAVPDTKAAKVAVKESGKADTGTIKKVDSELNNYLKGLTKDSVDGPIGKVDPASFFGAGKTMPYTEDEDGNRIYQYNGREIKIDGETAKDWEEEFKGALPSTPSEAAKTPGVKYIPVDTFRQANQALEQIKGPGAVDPVEYQLARENRNYLAQPAIAAAIQNPRADVGGLGGSVLNPARAFSAPKPIPATTIAGQSIPEVVPQRTSVPSIEPGADIPTAVNVPSAMAYLNSGVDPIYAQINAKAKQAALVPRQEVARVGGRASTAQIKEIADKVADMPNLTDEQRHTAYELKLNQIMDKNAAPSSGYDKVLGGINATADLLNEVDQRTSPGALTQQYVRKGIDYLSSNPGLGVAALAQARASAAADRAQLNKQFVADRLSGVIGPDVTFEDYTKPTVSPPSDVPEMVTYGE